MPVIQSPGLVGRNLTITVAGVAREYPAYGRPGITAIVTPAISQLSHGDTMEDMTGWATWMDPDNYDTPVGSIVSVTASFLGADAPAASDDALTEFQQVGAKFTVRHSLGHDISFTTALITVFPLAPTVNVAATLEGSTAVGETLDGGDADFQGSALTLTREHEVSDDGSTGWTGTGTTAYTGPSMVLGKYYRFRSTATNLGGTAPSYSDVIGPVVAPTVGIVGLTGGQAVVGGEANLTMTANVGTITATKWGSSSGGSQYGTGPSPSAYTSGTLYATATIGGIDYTTSAPIEAAPSNEDLVITVLAVGAYSAGAIPVTMDGIGTDNGDAVSLVLYPANDPAPNIANVQAGLASGGAAALDDWTSAWAGTPDTLAVAGGIARQQVRLAAVVDDGVAPSDVKTSDAFLLSTTAATLSGCTAEETGNDVDVTVTSNLAFGTIYFGLRLSASAHLSASDIINTAGNCLETDSDDTPAADGTNSGGFLDLGGGTYVIDAVQVDDFGNVSSVVSSSSFVIASTFSVTEVLAGESAATASPITDTVPAGAADATKSVFLVLSYGQASAGTLTATLGGNAPDAEEVANTAYNSTIIRILRWDVPSGGDLALSLSNTANFAGVSYTAFVAVNWTTATPKNANNAAYGALDLSNAVNAGARIIGAAAMAANGTTGAFSYVGLTQDHYNASHNGNRDQALFSATAATTETRTMTVTPTGDGSGQVAAALLILE